MTRMILQYKQRYPVSSTLSDKKKYRMLYRVHSDQMALRNGYVWSILVIISILMAACGENSTPSSSQTASNVLQAVTPPPTPLVCPDQTDSESKPTDYVSEDGPKLIYHNAPVRFYGYTSYPGAIGGAAAWHKPDFTQYIDFIMQMGSRLGQNLFRPTDYWDQSDDHPEQGSDNVWKNLDYLVCAAQKQGIFVEMDLSAFQKVLISQHLNDLDPNNWKSFLTAVGKHYRNQSAIAFYSILGEATAPKTTDAMDKLVAFYRTTTDTLHEADSNHLIMAGGFNHMEDESPSLPWWRQIYSLPNNNIPGFKTYSLNDLHFISTIVAFTNQIGKPAFDEEFGMQQSLGDATFAGGEGIDGIRTSRAQFYEDVYSTGESAGVQGFVFWDLGCDLRSTSYQVNPNTPATWKVIQKHGPRANKTSSPDQDRSLC
jgi:Cellulase (glycosyl hydrolase family 5)